MRAMSEWMWYLTRSTGIVAAVLAVASLVWGFTFSARNTGRRLKANWWLALHNWLGGLTLGFTGAHMLLAFLDTQAGLRFIDLFVPSGQVGWAIGWGVVAFWVFAVVTLTSIARVRRRLPRKAWHLVHLVSVPAVLVMAIHAYQIGSDALARWFLWGLAGLAGLAIYPLSVRRRGVAASRRAAASSTRLPARQRAAA